MIEYGGPRRVKAQQEIVRLSFRAGEPVRFNDEGRVFLGYVHKEANGRPGWYYVRDLDNRVHLVMWSDISAPADEL